MKNEAVKSLSSVIRANTEKRSLDELAAAGKKSVRVISGSRVMELMRAVVDDAIQRETMEIVQADRDRIVSRTKEQFDRVLAIQAKQDEALRQEKARTREALAELEAARERLGELTESLKRERAGRGGREAELLADSQERIAGLMSEKLEAEARIQAAVDTTQVIERMLEEEKNRHAREVEEYRAEIERLRRRIARVEEDRDELIGRVEAERSELSGRRERELADAHRRIEELVEERQKLLHALGEAEEKEERLRERLDEAWDAVESYRREFEEMDRKTDSEREKKAELSVASLRDEVAELNDLVRSFGKRPAGIDDRALDRLARQFGSQRSEMEERFDSQMEKTLSEVTRVLKVATARPLDEAVEATDALVDRIFDDAGRMKSNFSDLEVEERTSRSGIDNHLDRLREARDAFSTRGPGQE